MNPTPPMPNLLVIRSPDIHHAARFYEMLGMRFELHAHGNGPKHYSASTNEFVFEIYPARHSADVTTATRLGFIVDSVDDVVRRLEAIGAKTAAAPQDSEWGRRAVVRDFDGHSIELLTPQESQTNAN